MSEQFSFSVSRPTHRIRVKNVRGAKLDSKSFSISAPNHSTIQIYEIILEFKERYFHKIFTQPVIFEDDLRINKTHEITIIPIYNKERSKSISFKLPANSSEEIAAVIKEYLYTGKTTENNAEVSK